MPQLLRHRWPEGRGGFEVGIYPGPLILGPAQVRRRPQTHLALPRNLAVLVQATGTRCDSVAAPSPWGVRLLLAEHFLRRDINVPPPWDVQFL